ncbi:MAG: hypothetical protein EAZ25_05735 [Oscillatoriales cyanobacterium]|nr:MAG: hypothetical protein EAZ25_05735 [Oscillatoriales cyanobacterium]
MTTESDPLVRDRISDLLRRVGSPRLNPNSASVFNPPHPKGLVLRCQSKRAGYTWLAWTDLPRFSGSPFATIP